MLVPVWLLSYNYGAKAFQVIVNGYTGKIAGRYPYSVWKIVLLIWRRSSPPLSSDCSATPEAFGHEDLHRADAVTPADLLSVCSRARLEADRQFADGVPGSQQPGL